MTVADSDVLIDFLNGREPACSRVRSELSTGRLATTSINAFEIVSGALAKRDQKKVHTLLDAMTILSVDGRAAELGARVRRDLEASGKGIGNADYLIAGVCLVHGAVLLTRNLDHFRRVPDLQISA
jgi:tRNA(fMet)-specific endonuclease VapC